MSSSTASPTDPPLTLPPCSKENECSAVAGAVCDEGSCLCPADLPVYIQEAARCMTDVRLSEECKYDEQCLATESDVSLCGADGLCGCVKGYFIRMHPSVGIGCVRNKGSGTPVDPAMIGALVGLALMFIIICVVLRLFSKARFRETPSIFNTPNPRLMNASLFKDSKLLSPSRQPGSSRRGSRVSGRVPSRSGSVASPPPTRRSPTGSVVIKGRRGSVLSTASAAGRSGSPAPTDSARHPSPIREKKSNSGSSVAIETVD